MMRLRLSPYDSQIIQHPVFQHEARGLQRWVSSPEHLQRLNWRVLLRVHVLLLLGWLGLATIMALTPSNRAGLNTFMFRLYWSSSELIWLLFTAAIGAGALLDMSSMRLTLNSISSEVVTGRWELLRLTLLSVGGIVNAKHHVAQLRVWRLAFIVVCFRLATVTLLFLLVFVLPYLALGYNDTVEEFGLLVLTEPHSAGLVLLIVGLALGVYVIEPLWRMKAVTAMGMAISSYTLDLPLAMLFATLAVFGMWVAQVMVFVALVIGLGAGFNLFVMQVILDVDVSNFAWLLYFLLSGLVMAATIYGFYSIIQAWGLRRSLTRLARFN